MAEPLYDGRQARHRLRVVVVGCGLAGLSAAITLSASGHTVTLLDAASSPTLREARTGAGIQVSPNMSKILVRWGLAGALEKLGVQPQAAVLRRYSDGAVVGYSCWDSETMTDRYGAGYYHLHRADLHRILFDRAISSPNVSLKLGTRVTSIDPDAPSVTLSSGDVLSADLIIGADGVHSLVRHAVVGRPAHAQRTGDAAYRAVIPTSLMMDDPQLRELVERPEMTTWMGPGRHIMGYCVRARQEYNVVMLHPDSSPIPVSTVYVNGSGTGGNMPEDWTSDSHACSAEQMRADFADFEPRVRALLARIDRPLKWRLRERPPNERWVHPSGKVVLIGDACHPMLPYRAQGAALSLEDAAFLGSLLSRLQSPSALPALLTAYESLRTQRATTTFESASLNRFTFHLPDGPAQEARDRSMRRAMRTELRAARARGIGVGLALEGGMGSIGSFGTTSSEADSCSIRSGETPNSAGIYGSLDDGIKKRKNADNANQWADAAKNDAQYGYDAEAEADAWWGREGAELVERLEREEEELAKLNAGGGGGGAARGVEGRGGEKGWKKTFGSSFFKRTK
ncbi:FAD/NAD(P)-binding domain-containing protein [Schizopora paradoxa]|uniref:FAD/NAD(P)-binding domain-containing protein n=1 Tax=Schizopora paradoxa TaxID=27342 RepID=A0A0H2R4K9_9AGAM|nr:FAD/NAD(P)-binding domain-containing protein [Schizopora paradoxa]